MKIKRKLQLGLGLLFLIALLIGILSGYYINRLSRDADAILKDNYESLQYTRYMQAALYDGKLSDNEYKLFEDNLSRQELNITEKGEAGPTSRIRTAFEALRKGGHSGAERDSIYLVLQTSIGAINEVNLQAIYRKNQTAQNSVKTANSIIALSTVFCLMVGFSFYVNFPGYIANPIRELTEGITAIANKNYRQRLEFSSKDEFGELAIAFNKMAAKLEDFESSNLAKILFEKKRIETIIDHMNEAIIGLDESNHILFVNSEAVNLLGLPKERLNGYYAPDVALHNDLLRTLVGDREKKELKIYADNKESYFSRDVIHVENEGQSLGRVIVLRNITSFHELDQAKTNFIATVSHELKTPIASIKMSLKLLEDKRIGEMNTEQIRLVDHIQEDANRLLKITGELLDLAQVETGNIQLNLTPTVPDQIVTYALAAVQFQAQQKQVEFDLHLHPGLPGINADLEKTAWVLVNFLSNALRYSAERTKINLEVKQAGDYVVFTVQDFGKGIEEKYRKRIFERYFQVPTDGRDRSGTGLGLAISKDFIEAQHGEIFVESEYGSGSTFGFRLPVMKG